MKGKKVALFVAALEILDLASAPLYDGARQLIQTLRQPSQTIERKVENSKPRGLELTLSGTAHAQTTAEASTRMNKVPGLDYEFDGGVYIWKTPEFPKDRYKFSSAYKQRDNDLDRLFKIPELYSTIGKYLEPAYKRNELISLAFDKNNSKEIAVSIKSGNNYYVGFKRIDASILSTLQKYNIK